MEAFMQYSHLVSLAFIGALCAAGADDPRRYSGPLEPQLVADPSVSWGTRLTPVAGDALRFTGQLKLGGDLAPLPVLLVESPGAEAVLYADLNRDGRFAEAEKFALIADPDRPRASGEATILLPMDAGPFAVYPIRVTLFRPENEQAPRRIAYSFLAYATGTIDVEGQHVRVWCSYDLRTHAVDPHNSTVGMDLDGDGIMGMPPSPEWANAKNEAAVFRLGTRYLSIARIDTAAHTIALSAHPESDYRIIEISPGAVAPDFEFTDFNGRVRRLSEFKGRYVLLVFWGSWCKPCIEQFPHLKRAYSVLHRRGLEIAGIDTNDTLEDGKKCVVEHGLSWVQATAESTNDLVEKRFRITAYPTVLLLDPQRRILSTGRDDFNLYGEELFKTLESILPPQT